MTDSRIHTAVLALSALTSALASGCGSANGPGPDQGPACGPSASYSVSSANVDLKNRAYVASRDSGNVTVIDLKTLEVIASLDTCRSGYHMVELSADFSKVYASNTGKSRLDVIDAKSLDVKGEIEVGEEPTHLSLSRDGNILAVIDEGNNAVSFIDPKRDVEVKRLTGFYTPHFVRFAPDGDFAYVANLGAYHVTRVALSTLSIDGHIPLDGFDAPPQAMETIDYEGGFADVQIDKDGVLWGAHRETGQTLVYDTKTQKKLPQVFAGPQPWIVYAEHPFTEVDARAVPTWGNRSVALLEGKPPGGGRVVTEESESYGVNYSSRAPEKAFVMNRQREEIAVVNTLTNHRDAIIAVGGTTETASTTADGKLIIAAVSSANSVVVIDATTNEVVKTFDHIGNYPWTVTIPLGQNYCH